MRFDRTMLLTVLRTIIVATFAFGAGLLLRPGETHAQDQQARFVKTGSLASPEGTVTRMEDKQFGVICYTVPGTGILSCVKK